MQKTRSGGNDFNYFKLTKLANFVQFKRFVLSGRWGDEFPAPPLATPLGKWQTGIDPAIAIVLPKFHYTNQRQTRYVTTVLPTS